MKLHLEIDRRYGSYITPSLTRTLEQAARCGTLDQAENVLRASATRDVVDCRPHAGCCGGFAHLARPRTVLCALVMERP